MPAECDGAGGRCISVIWTQRDGWDSWPHEEVPIGSPGN